MATKSTYKPAQRDRYVFLVSKDQGHLKQRLLDTKQLIKSMKETLIRQVSESPSMPL
jgi:hypothetical protein